MKRTAYVFVAMLFGFAATAAAQSPASTSNPSDGAAGSSEAPLSRAWIPPVFVTGVYFSGVQRAAHTSTNEPGLVVDLSGTTTGGGVGIGTCFTPHLSVQFEMSLPGTLSVVSSTPTQTNGTPASFVEQLAVHQTTHAGTVLLGYHTSTDRRVRVAYLGGLAIIADRQVSDMVVSSPIALPVPGPQISTSVTYRSGATAGLDVDVAIVRHLAVSPELRVYAFNGTLLLQTAVGVRVIF